ncbi:patatin-like phospholipase family protein [Candidatus Pacearchaeota archaeon]|nr:patatin-like phospholipase family protein [Candidatus Pacearchaeota archaeon]
MKNVMLYLGGGSMMGIFGGGILKRLSDERVYDKIETIYSVSAGAFNAAYFIAGHIKSEQIDIGASIYYENLQEDFIFSDCVLPAARSRLMRRSGFNIEDRNVLNVVNVDHMMSVVRTTKILDIEALNQSTIPVYVKVFDLKEMRIVYLNLKEETLSLERCD